MVGCILFAAVVAASGQEVSAPEKRAAVAKLIEVENIAGIINLTFARMLARVREPFADSMITHLKAKGFFKTLSPAEGAELERRIQVFYGDVLDECARRMSREVLTTENVARVAAPLIDKHFTLDEINQALALNQTPLGRKIAAAWPEAIAESKVASLEAKGVFAKVSSPEELAAKMRGLRKELKAEADEEMYQVLAKTVLAVYRQLSKDEQKEWDAMRATPSARKYGEPYFRMHAELVRELLAFSQPRTGMIAEIYQQKLGEYAVWLSEATRPGAPRGGAKPPLPTIKRP